MNSNFPRIITLLRKERGLSQKHATMARYKTQFTSLDVLVTKMTNTANYLTQQFSQK